MIDLNNIKEKRTRFSYFEIDILNLNPELIIYESLIVSIIINNNT